MSTPESTHETPDRCDGYREDLLRFCRRYLGHAADAEDVVQEVGARLADQDHVDDARPWMFRVARNLCLNRLRDRQRPGDVALRTDVPLAASQTGPFTALARDERDAALHAALASMPADLTEVLTLRYFDGFGRREIGQVLGRPERQVKSLLDKARQEIARKLRGLRETGS